MLWQNEVVKHKSSSKLAILLFLPGISPSLSLFHTHTHIQTHLPFRTHSLTNPEPPWHIKANDIVSFYTAAGLFPVRVSTLADVCNQQRAQTLLLYCLQKPRPLIPGDLI